MQRLSEEGPGFSLPRIKILPAVLQKGKPRLFRLGDGLDEGKQIAQVGVRE